MDELRKKEAALYFQSNSLFGSDNTLAPTESQLRDLLEIAFHLLEIPTLAPELWAKLANPHIVNFLFIHLWNALSTDQRLSLAKLNIRPTVYIRSDQKSNFEIKTRILGRTGIYPSVALQTNEATYAAYHGFPMLITKQQRISEDDSEVSFLNRQELRAATAVILARERSLLHFYFEDLSVISLDLKALENFEKEQEIQLLFELLLISLRFRQPSGIFETETSLPSISVYKFSDFRDDVDSFYHLYNSFDTSDELLMRTSFYLVKSIMLWSNRSFGEDAIANALFAIEGALLLIQKKIGVQYKDIDLDCLADFFRSNFERGEELFDFIREGYDKRITIVHASPKWDIEWSPFFSAEDFYEYFHIVKFLLNYILIDRIISIE